MMWMKNVKRLLATSKEVKRIESNNLLVVVSKIVFKTIPKERIRSNKRHQMLSFLIVLKTIFEVTASRGHNALSAAAAFLVRNLT